MKSKSIKSTIENLVKAIESEEFDTVEAIFANDVVNSVTDKNGDAFHLKGVASYIEALKRMNFSKTRPKLNITQINLISDHEALFMLEVIAQKGSHKLHNYVAYFARFRNNKIISMDMVEALPEYSDKFWNEF